MSITPMKPSYDPAPEFLREPAPQDESLSYPGDVEEQPLKWRTGEEKPETGKDSNMRFMLIAGIVLAGLLIFLAGMFTGAAIVSPDPVDDRASTIQNGSAADGDMAGSSGKSETLMAPKKAPPVVAQAAPPAAAPSPAAPKVAVTPKAAVAPPPAAPAVSESAAPAAAAPAAPLAPSAAVTAPPPVAAPPAPKVIAPPPPSASLAPPKPPALPSADAPAKADDLPPAPPLEQLARDLEGQGGTKPKALAKPAPAPVAAGSFSVQVGAFSSKTNADRLVARFGKQGVEGFVVRGTDSQGRTLYYVRSGSFETREKARIEADRIKKVAGTAAIVVAPGKDDVRL